MICWYRYVPPADVPRWVAVGWVDCGPVVGHHGAWSRLVRYDGDEPALLGVSDEVS